jgi:hypothetical protein
MSTQRTAAAETDESKIKDHRFRGAPGVKCPFCATKTGFPVPFLVASKQADGDRQRREFLLICHTHDAREHKAQLRHSGGRLEAAFSAFKGVRVFVCGNGE